MNIFVLNAGRVESTIFWLAAKRNAVHLGAPRQRAVVLRLAGAPMLVPVCRALAPGRYGCLGRCAHPYAAPHPRPA